MRSSPQSFAGLICLGLVAWLPACGDSGKQGPAPIPEPAEVAYGTIRERDRSGRAEGADFTAVVAAQNELTLRLLSDLRARRPDENLAVGGYSVNQVLGMLYAGAGGATLADLKTALGWELPAERLHAALNALDLEILSRGGDVTLAIANRVWAQKGLALLPDFLDVLTRDYGAPLALADFAGDPDGGRAAVNGWVAEATRQKIPELLPAGSITGQTKVVLANALYLDAPWKYRFDPQKTRKRAFTLGDETEVEVDMMHFDEFLPSAYDPDWQAVELPYHGDELSMIVIVPRDLEVFESRLSAKALNAVFAKIQPGGIHLSLPKFTFSFHTSLVDTLKALGMASLFEGADFSGMVAGGGGLAVTHVEHEVFIEVDEEGTKAAAATGAAIADSHGPSVTVSRPFLFVIRDRPTGTILFLGRVLDPRARNE